MCLWSQHLAQVSACSLLLSVWTVLYRHGVSTEVNLASGNTVSRHLRAICAAWQAAAGSWLQCMVLATDLAELVCVAGIDCVCAMLTMVDMGSGDKEPSETEQHWYHIPQLRLMYGTQICLS